MFGIEYVCIGNNGRSPAAQAVAEQYVEEKGLGSIIKISSSGTNVSPDKTYGIKAIEKVLVKVKDSSYLSQNLQKSIINFLQDPGIIKKYESDVEFRRYTEKFMRDVVSILVQEEAKIRDCILAEHGLKCKKQEEQTTARSDTKLILPMTASLVARVEKIYAGSGYSPKICALPEYSEVEGVFEGTLGSGADKYMQFFETIKIAVPQSIGKAVEEFHLV